MTPFDIIRRDYAYEILLKIRDNPHITKKELMRLSYFGTDHTIFNRISELEELGLVKHIHDEEDRRKRGMYNSHHLYLTEKGQVIASLLQRIDNELSKNEV